MEEVSGEMHSGDDKALAEKNKKRTVKTRAQVQALEKFYDEHKYPTETMKLQLAESIGLTEKQVSGWFCHRRLKDKRLMNGEHHATGRQDRSSGVIQDRGSGHRQDSCGSTKLGEERNFDTREVESGMLLLQDSSAAELAYERQVQLYTGDRNRMDNASSGSNSSLRNMSNHHSGDPIDVATSRHLVRKFPLDVKDTKTRSGPSGYLKVKGQVENAAITAVKRQLGKHYREDGPPLGVEFDPLPPGAFESSMQDPVDETYYSEEAAQPASPDVSKSYQYPKFNKEHQYNSDMVSHNSNLDGTSFRMRRGPDIPDNHIHQKFTQNTSLPDIPDNHIHQKFTQNTSLAYNGAYYPRKNSSVEFPEGSTGNMPGSESRDDYGMWRRQSLERVRSIPNHRNLQPCAGKVRAEREPRIHKYDDSGTKVSRGENIDKTLKSTMKGYELHESLERGMPRQITRDGKPFAERRIINENRAIIPFKNNATFPKRARDEFLLPQHVKRSLLLDNQPGSHRVMRSTAEVPSSFSEDEESAETSASAD